MKNQIKNILVPIDLSETSLNALNTAIQMAKRHGAQLHLLYVQDLMDYYPKMGQIVTLEPMMEEIYVKDEMLLEKTVKAIFSSHQVNCFLHMASGSRPIVIPEKAKKLGVDLIVMGTDPNINAMTYLNDSLPYKVLQQVNCNLLTVPAGREINGFGRIVFPVTTRGNAVEKLKLSQAIIAGNKARLSVIGLVRTQDLPFINIIRSLSAQVKSKVSRFAGSVNRKTIYALNPANELKKICRNEDADLIIMEGNTQRNLKQFFFGNFTQRMIRNAAVAVLFVNKLSVRQKVQSAYH